MRGKDYYYSEISKALKSFAPELEQAFSEVAKNKSGREVYFWLFENQKDRVLPEEINDLIRDFYWEVFCSN